MGPAVAPLDLVDQQDPPAVDLVLLVLSRSVHVDRVIDDPRVPRFVGDDRIVPRREPVLALEQHQAVRNAARLLERGVRVMGIDAWSWDAPLHLQAQQAELQAVLGGAKEVSHA